MQTSVVVSLLLVALGSAPAQAHAFLDHASPLVGSTVPSAPHEVALRKSSAGFQLRAGNGRQRRAGRSGQSANQRRHHADRPEIAGARHLQGALACAFRRYAHHGRKFLFPRRSPLSHV